MKQTRHIKLNVLLCTLCASALLAAHCGNSSASSPNRARALSAPESTTTQAIGARAQPPAPTTTRQSCEADQTPPPPPESEPVDTGDDPEESEVRIRRLVVATGVEGREPMGGGARFTTDNDRIFAFLEAVNESDAERELVVTFESEDGDEVGYINLDIPANTSRWRTWAYSRNVRAPGSWMAIIRSEDGAELARERFVVEG